MRSRAIVGTFFPGSFQKIRKGKFLKLIRITLEKQTFDISIWVKNGKIIKKKTRARARGENFF